MKYRNTIKSWRLARGLTQQQLADAGDTAKNYISYLERGERPYNQELIERLARALDTTVVNIIAFEPGAQAAQSIPIAGRAAAGPEGFYFSDYADGAHDTIDPYPEGSIAAVVTGRSMWPRFKDNEKIIFGAQTTDIDACVGRDVLAHLSDGRMLIKTLRRGESGGLILKSYNDDFEDIVGVRIEWVRRFEGMRA